MLVLTRKKGQSIIIGDGIEISVEGVNGDSVRIGVRAPKDISIYRSEIYEAIREENISAARTASEMATQFKKAAPPSSEEEEKKD